MKYSSNLRPLPSKVAARPARLYIPTLDGWRAVAILSVIFAHSVLWSGTGLGPISHALHWPGLSGYIYRYGDKGVEIFFCLSGFLITTLLVQEHGERGSISLRAFYARRVCRILPAALTFLLIASLCAVVGAIHLDWSGIAAAIFFVRNYVPTGNHWYTGHFWSLSVEEHFYIVWPTVLAIAGLRRSRRLAAASIAAVVIWRAIALQHPLTFAATIYHTDLRADALMLGSLAALLFPALKQRLSGLSPVWFVAAVLAYFAGDISMAALPSIGRLVREAAVVGAIVFTLVHEGSLVATFLESPFMRWIGRISYSLYLWQQLFFRPPRTYLWEWPLRVAMVFICAYLSYQLIERPMIRVGRRWSESIYRTAPVEVPAATSAAIAP